MTLGERNGMQIAFVLSKEFRERVLLAIGHDPSQNDLMLFFFTSGEHDRFDQRYPHDEQSN